MRHLIHSGDSITCSKRPLKDESCQSQTVIYAMSWFEVAWSFKIPDIKNERPDQDLWFQQINDPISSRFEIS